MADTEYSGDVQDYCSTLAECRRVSRLVRSVAGAHRSVPVEVVEGDSRPVVVGQRGYRTWSDSPDATRVRCDLGCRWRTYYWCSTLRVEVGRDWLLVACDLRADTPPEVALDYVADRLGT